VSEAVAARVRRVLEEHATGMDLLQVTRLLEAVHREQVPVGQAGPPWHEVARFSVRPSLAFPPGDVHAVEETADAPDRVEVNVFGLVGPDAVLPHIYTRLVAREESDGNPAVRDFFDIFQHRLLSLLVRALRKTNVALAREYGGAGADRLLLALGDIMGVPLHRDAELGAPAGAAPFAGLAGPQRRSALGLEQLLRGRFDVPVEVEPFVGGWMRLSEEDCCSLGDETPATRLGQGAVVGDEIWDPHARVRVRLGPLDRATFNAFLPGGRLHEPLRDLCRFFVHDQFVVEACLIFERDDVPECVVSDDPDGPALGWSTWLRTRPLDRDPDETLLTL
jgi:type VI secretion system protein ImpH